MPELTDKIESSQAFFPTPRDLYGNDILVDADMEYWVNLLQDYAAGPNPTIIQIMGSNHLWPNPSYSENILSDLEIVDLDELLMALVMSNDVRGKEIIQLVYNGEVVKNLKVDSPSGIPNNIYCDLYPVRVGSKIVGSRFEFHRSTDEQIAQLKADNTRAEELLQLTQDATGANPYSFYCSPENLNLQDILGIFLNPRQMAQLENRLSKSDEIDETFIMPTNIEEFTQNLLNLIDELRADPLKTTIQLSQLISGYDAKNGFLKTLRNDIKLEKEPADLIKISGCIVDISDSIEQSTFHTSLLDILLELTKTNDYGEQLRLIVEKLKQLIPNLSTISVYRPDGKGGFKDDIRHKYDDARIENFEAITNNLAPEAIKLMQSVVDLGEIRIIGNHMLNPETVEFAKKYNAYSYVGVPIKNKDGAVIAIINLSSDTPNAFSQYDLKKIDAIRSFLMLAIEKDSFVKELQVAIKDAVTELGELLRVLEVSIHDLKTPLTVITTRVYLHRKNLEKAMVDASIYDTSLNQLNTIVRDIADQLDLTLEQIKRRASMKEEIKKLRFWHTLGEIKESVESLCHKRKEDGTNTDVKVNFIAGNIPGGFEFDTRESGFRRVLLNLIGNAIKYSKNGEKGIVNVYSNLVQNSLQIKIEDNGIGIPIEDRVKVFENEGRAGNVESREGHGIGLSYVKTFIESMGGKVELDTSVICGTEFIVTLPLSEKVGFLMKDASTQEA